MHSRIPQEKKNHQEKKDPLSRTSRFLAQEDYEKSVEFR